MYFHGIVSLPQIMQGFVASTGSPLLCPFITRLFLFAACDFLLSEYKFLGFTSLPATQSAYTNLEQNSYNMKRSMPSPQGQSGSSNKRPRIQTENPFQQAFARILDVPDFPAQPPVLAAGPESLVRVPTMKAEKEIERLLGLDTKAKPMFADETKIKKRSRLPDQFATELNRKYQRGDIDGNVLDYYSDILPRGDSTTVPGQGGRALLLKSIMRQEDSLPAALVAGPAWRPVRALGKGAFGEGMSIGKSRSS